MTTTKKRPKIKTDPEPIRIQGVTAGIMREKGTDEQDRPYWRARLGRPSRALVWSGYATREEAEAEVLAALRRGIPARRAASAAVGAVRTVDDLLVRWDAAQAARNEAGDLATQTLKGMRWAIGGLRESLGHVGAFDLALPDVEDAVAEWRSEGMSPRAVDTVLTHFRSAIRWGARRGLCADVPVREARPDVHPDEFVQCSTTPPRHHVELVLDAMRSSADWRRAAATRDLLELLSLTGARTGEGAALTVGSYDRENARVRLCGRDERRDRRGKTPARWFPVSGELVDLLERLTAGRPDEEPLLDLPQNPGSSLGAALRWACEYAAVPRFTPHGVRRMVVMELLEENDVKTVSLLTGHTVAVLLKHYVRPDADQLRAAVERSGIGQRRRGKVRGLRARR